MSRDAGKKSGAREPGAMDAAAGHRAVGPATTGAGYSVNVSSKEDFDAFVRLSRAKVGEPPWFATPVDAREDGDWYVLTFHVAGRSQTELSVTGSEQGVIVWGARRDEGPKREMRMLTLPDAIDSKSIEPLHQGEVLTVRVRKKRSDRGAKGASR
jgi:HSP20 family molecular chaperone IbpA